MIEFARTIEFIRRYELGNPRYDWSPSEPPITFSAGEILVELRLVRVMPADCRTVLAGLGWAV